MKHMPPSRLLATDLDNTLVGDPAALAAFNRWFGPRRHRWRLAYLTGRSLSSAWALVVSQGLLRPDALVTDVGTMIHLGRRHPPATRLDYAEDAAYHEELAAQWSGATVQASLADQPGLALQPGGVRPLRVSYWAETPGAAAAAAARIAALGLPVQAICSSGRDLDVLPRAAGKGAALRRLVRHWQVAAGQVVVCGDSGNDLDMLTAGFPGIVVANAQPELQRARLPDLVQRAVRPYAWGILDCLANGHT